MISGRKGPSESRKTRDASPSSCFCRRISTHDPMVVTSVIFAGIVKIDHDMPRQRETPPISHTFFLRDLSSFPTPL